jgi:hypothetical protein
MARVFYLDSDAEILRKSLSRSLQSGRINFLIGSGASLPSIPVAGTIEKEIADLLASGNEVQARSRKYEFIAGVQGPTNALISGAPNVNNTVSLEYYREYLEIIQNVLAERRTNLLPKQATIFSTNYDLLLEKASVAFGAMRLNDGFSRAPSLDGRMEYSSRNFFMTYRNVGNLYSYTVEIPCVNLIKLHGSLSWARESDNIVFRVAPANLLTLPRDPAEEQAFIDRYAIIFPEATKFRETLLDRTYYDLLRIYANELDRENALLLSFGFSFGDAHILDITKRALKNPTLRLVVFAHSEHARDTLVGLFGEYNNVEIISPKSGEVITFKELNQTLRSSVPVMGTLG